MIIVFVQNAQNSCQHDFIFIVDRIEGLFAVCELPDETICDIELSRFPWQPKDKEKYIGRVGIDGNIEVLDKVVVTIPESLKHKIPSRFIRF